MNSFSGLKQIPQQYISLTVFNYCKTLLLPNKKKTITEKNEVKPLIRVRKVIWSRFVENINSEKVILFIFFFVLNLLRGLFSHFVFPLSSYVWVHFSIVRHIICCLHCNKTWIGFCKTECEWYNPKFGPDLAKIEESSRVSFDKNHFGKMHRFEQYCFRHRTPRASGSVKISTHK